MPFWAGFRPTGTERGRCLGRLLLGLARLAGGSEPIAPNPPRLILPPATGAVEPMEHLVGASEGTKPRLRPPGEPHRLTRAPNSEWDMKNNVQKVAFAYLCGCAAFASVARGDIVFNFERLTVSTTQPHYLVPDAGSVLAGELSGVTIDVRLDAASSPSAQARWLTLYVQRPIAGFHVQVGGWANQGAQQFYGWETGASSDPGTVLSERIDFSPAVIASQIASGGFNGISFGMPSAGGSPMSVTFTGSLTLHGVSYIPAPAAAPLLALAGLLTRSRRRA